MKAVVRESDKIKTLELLSDMRSHTNREIEAATGSWFVKAIIKALKKQGHRFECMDYGNGVVCYKLKEKQQAEQKNLFG